MNILSAEGLRIRPAERSALIEIRELFAKNVFHHDEAFDVEKPDGFNMIAIDEENECGTTCCIGGWMFRSMRRDRVAPCHIASDYVTLDCSDALKPLFFPFQDETGAPFLDDDGFAWDFPWESIPPAFALKAIDNFLSTGDPDWPSACGLRNIEVRDNAASAALSAVP